MKRKETKYIHIERNYVITSKELKSKLGIQGEIININLRKSRSPIDIEKKKSSDLDEWEINTLVQGTEKDKDVIKELTKKARKK